MTADLQCIHRAGCTKPKVCGEIGHCTSMTAEECLNMAKLENDSECSVMTPVSGKTLLELAVEERNRPSNLVPHTAQEIADELRAIGKGGEGYELSPAQFRTIERAADALEAISLPFETTGWRGVEKLAEQRNAAYRALESIRRCGPGEGLHTAIKIASDALDGSSEEPSRELSPSEATSFDKALARSPRRVLEPSGLGAQIEDAKRRIAAWPNDVRIALGLPYQASEPECNGLCHGDQQMGDWLPDAGCPVHGIVATILNTGDDDER